MKSIFSKRIKELRKKKGLTQSDIAYDLDMDRASYSNWETGKREPNFNMLYTLADYFDVTADYLIGREKTYAELKQEAYEQGKKDNQNYIIDTDEKKA